MAAHQSKIAIADGGPIMTTARRPPMTSKQAKKAFAKANNVPKMNWKERKRMEAAELAAQKREFEKEKAQAKARALKAKKDAKEEAEKAERKKAGIPEKSRWVRPSQGRITGFLGLGKRGRDKDVEDEEEDESADDAEEPMPKRVAVGGADDDTEEEDDTEERESYAPETPAIKTLRDTEDEGEDAQPEDGPRHVDGDLVVRKEKENSPETQPEEQVQQIPGLEVEVEPELVVRSDPEVQPEVESRSDPEVQIEQENRPDLDVQTKIEVQPEPAVQEEPEIQADLDVCAEPLAHEESGAQTKSEDHSASNPHDQNLPANSQYFTSSQDFLDDDDIFLELAAAHQLLSESFDAGERSQAAAAQSSPVLATKEALICAKSNASETVVAHSPKHYPDPVAPAKPASFIPSPPKQQPESRVLQRTPRPRMEFECSGISPELTHSSPFSQKQAALRSVSKAIPRPNAAAVAPVMGHPTSITRRRTTVSTPIRSQIKNMPPPNMVNSPLHRTTRGVVLGGSTCRLPLNDISRQAQNVPSKAQPSSSCPKPFLKPSLPPNHAPKVSPFAPPTSTQLFLADHLDDFFPSPSQELRELLEDIEDDDIPSNTQVAREIGRDNVVARPILIEPAQPTLDDDFPWASSRDFVFSSQELRELESPIKASPVPAPPPPTPWDVRRARKPRFFVEKEEDLFAAAIHESKLQGKVDDEATKLRLENMRIERELLGTRQPSQRHAPSVRRPIQDSVRIEAGADDLSEQLEGLNASQLAKLMDEIESDEYCDDFDDDDAEASMIAFADKLETPIARSYESETESETESEKHESFIQRFMDQDANAVADAEDYYAFL